MTNIQKAQNIREENIFDSNEENRRWIATHQGCNGTLLLIDDDWQCDQCGVVFHDDHCADIVAERRDRAAREKASAMWASDPFLATTQLEQERASIAKDRKQKAGYPTSKDVFTKTTRRNPVTTK